jgi:hypothetical protein
LPTGCYDEQVTPYVKTNVPQEVPEELKVGFTNTAGSGNLVQWLVDGEPMLIDLDYPTLQHVADGNDSFAAQRNVLRVGEKNQVSLIIRVFNSRYMSCMSHVPSYHISYT